MKLTLLFPLLACCYLVSAQTQTQDQNWTIPEATQEAGFVQEGIDSEDQSQFQQEQVQFGQQVVVAPWAPVNLSNYTNDSNISYALNYGYQYVVSQGIYDHILPAATYNISQVNNISIRVLDALNYNFDVLLNSTNGTSVRVMYQVWYQPWINTIIMQNYLYNYTGPNPDGGVSNLEVEWSDYIDNSIDVVDLSSEAIATPLNATNITNVTNVTNVTNITDATNVTDTTNVTDLTNSTNSTDLAQDALPANMLIVGSYAGLNASEYNTPEIQNLLNFGAQAAVQQGVQNGLIPNTTFNVSQVLGVYSQAVVGTNYQFNVILDNGVNETAQVDYVVYSDPASNTTVLSSYEFIGASGY